MKIQLVVVVVRRRVSHGVESCGAFAGECTKKVAVSIQMPSVIFQTSLDRNPERKKFLPIGLVTRQKKDRLVIPERNNVLPEWSGYETNKRAEGGKKVVPG
jgi:hypothetical protein